MGNGTRSRAIRAAVAALALGLQAQQAPAADPAFRAPTIVVEEGWWLDADYHRADPRYADEVGIRSLWANGPERLVVERLGDGRTRIWLYAATPGVAVPERGTRLFLGRIGAGGAVEGTWSLQAPSCGTLPFPVSGERLEGGGVMALSGDAPMIGPDCTLGELQAWSVRLQRMGKQPFLPDTPYEEDGSIDPFPGILPYGLPLSPRSGGRVAFHATEESDDVVGRFAAEDATSRPMTLADYSCVGVDWETVRGDEAIDRALESCALRIVFDRHDGWVRGGEMKVDWSAWE